MIRRLLLAIVPGAAVLAGLSVRGQIPAQTPPPPQQPSAIEVTIGGGDPTAPPRLALPDFIALTPEPETRDAARAIAAVLWSDFEFEREFSLIPKDVVASVPAAKAMTDVPFDRWRELNVDGVIVGTVQRIQKPVGGIRVELRLFNVRTRQSVFGKSYDSANGDRDRRWLAHTVSDEIHLQQRNVQGVARTKLTFNSDRSNERMRNTIENRGVKEIFISDYDGENQTRVIANGSLNIASAWSPDGQSLAYTSWRGGAMQVYLSHPYKGTGEPLTRPPGENYLPAWSPDGKRVAFVSNRDGNGNSEIYVMNRDGSNQQRLTNHPGIDVSPTWSPTGTLIAFVSDRAGPPELFVMQADGLGLARLTHEGTAVDRPTWSPAPFNEIAYSWKNGPGFDIKILDFTSRESRQITTSQGSNESPAFSPSGRHLAFNSTRSGKEQLFTVGRDGRGLRQLTTTGNNRQANWSRGPGN